LKGPRNVGQALELERPRHFYRPRANGSANQAIRKSLFVVLVVKSEGNVLFSTKKFLFLKYVLEEATRKIEGLTLILFLFHK
jgi:hypothetical protein